MNERILIAYATRAKSTYEIAAEIGKNLGQQGFDVDVIPVKDNPSLDEYHAVILGSAIRMGSWLPEAVEFVKENQPALGSMPVALFTVHMLNTGDDEDSYLNRMAYLDKVRPLLDDPEEVYFAGKIDYARLSFPDRFIAKMVKAVEEDKRDWEAIRSWMPKMLAKERSYEK